MIWASLVVLNQEFMQQRGDCFVNEMSSLVDFRLLRHPNLEMIFSKMNLVVVSIVYSFTGAVLLHLVRCSVPMMMYLSWV